MAGRFLVAVFFSFFSILGGTSFANAEKCGGEKPCKVADGEYFIHLPPGIQPGEGVGAIFFVHGYKGSGLNEIRNKSFLKMADDLGVAFVAVNGIEGTWSFPNAPRALRNEFQYFDEVIDSVVASFPVNRNRIMLSGFSSGAFVTWYMACDNSERFAGYAPIAGAFWKPLPDQCATKTPYLFHVHGTQDKTVPFGGRPLGGGRWHQGDVMESFNVWLRRDGLTETSSNTYDDGELSCESWTPEQGFLELCLHQGGHSVKADWIKRAWLALVQKRDWQQKKS
ncbi:PHB depolymerase family esterase [Roseibium sp. RKSG952]|uniref:alpha/beta hydrolase family esterase n=1 Tax=Roseibium sp. RKSG952 TaxID=2529384 RepID=UPI0012BB5C10|nr:polyhydroxybutyrate depolymerase [Roseibium sp. RKSG952]MTI00324.1 polyhydroxybutyrate depolymerase [Roseibium sp. RKSG952]